MREPTVIAIDWSGAKGPGRKKGIWLCAKDTDGEVSRGTWTRSEVVDHIAAMTGPLVVGLDFCFGLPAWFAREHGCKTIDEVWALAERDGECWLAPAPPFWRDRCDVTPGRRFRKCEVRYPTAKSIFQVVGVGMVGPGSVRGMPQLARLRAAGFAIWPFDDPAERTVFEIYPTFLRKHSPHHDSGLWESNDERDAVVSARVMWDHRETVPALRAATDPTTRLEGDIWAPATASP